MPTMDSTAKAALDKPVIAPAFFIFLDVVADPIRVTTFGQDITFSGTGDADLDGFTFSSVNPEVINVGEVSNSESGSDTVTVELSGIASIDTQLLNDIGDTTKWRGRTCRLWFRVYDENDAAQGAIVAYYTGYMSSVEIGPSPEQQFIRLKVENYLAGPFSQASNRSYMNQKHYDSADTSAGATLAAANASRRGNTGVGTGGTGGGVDRDLGEWRNLVHH